MLCGACSILLVSFTSPLGKKKKLIKNDSERRRGKEEGETERKKEFKVGGVGAHHLWLTPGNDVWYMKTLTVTHTRTAACAIESVHCRHTRRDSKFDTCTAIYQCRQLVTVGFSFAVMLLSLCVEACCEIGWSERKSEGGWEIIKRENVLYRRMKSSGISSILAAKSTCRSQGFVLVSGQICWWCICVCGCLPVCVCVCVCVCVFACVFIRWVYVWRTCQSFTCGVEDSVDRAFLIASRLCSSSTSPYEDSRQEEERSPLLTALTIPVCTVCVCACVCVFEAYRHKDSSLTDSQLWTTPTGLYVPLRGSLQTARTFITVCVCVCVCVCLPACKLDNLRRQIYSWDCASNTYI